MRMRLDHSRTMGRYIATTGVLLTHEERSATGTIRRNCAVRIVFGRPSSGPAKELVAPVPKSAAATTKRDPIAITAGCANPAKALSGLTTPRKTCATRPPSMPTSTGTRLVASTAMTMPVMESASTPS